MQWRAGTVIEQVRQWPGAVECTRRCSTTPPTPPVRALAYTAMVGSREPGDRVLLNASALLRGLGTGGLAFVVAPPRPTCRPTRRPGPGHIVKARYTPHAADAARGRRAGQPAPRRRSPTADDLAGMPVVVADLHSALPAVLAGIRAGQPGCAGRLRHDRRRGAARGVLADRGRAGGCRVAGRDAHRRAGLRRRPRGRHDAHRAARGAARVGADVTVVAQGPGNVGTGTRWGYSGVACADALHAADVLGGRGVASLRVSGADRARAAPRHQPPQPHGLRPGPADAGRRAGARRCPTPSSTPWCAPSWPRWSAPRGRR